MDTSIDVLSRMREHGASCGTRNGHARTSTVWRNTVHAKHPSHGRLASCRPVVRRGPAGGRRRSGAAAARIACEDDRRARDRMGSEVLASRTAGSNGHTTGRDGRACRAMLDRRIEDAGDRQAQIEYFISDDDEVPSHVRTGYDHDPSTDPPTEAPLPTCARIGIIAPLLVGRFSFDRPRPNRFLASELYFAGADASPSTRFSNTFCSFTTANPRPS